MNASRFTASSRPGFFPPRRLPGCRREDPRRHTAPRRQPAAGRHPAGRCRPGRSAQRRDRRYLHPARERCTPVWRGRGRRVHPHHRGPDPLRRTRAPATDDHLAAFVAESEAQGIVDLTAGLYGDGHQRRDCTYVDDAVSATIAAATVPTAQGVINVGGGSGASLLEVISIARSLTGREAQVHQEHPRSGDVLTITERPRRPLPRPGLSAQPHRPQPVLGRLRMPLGNAQP
ncbi:NAD-dependent epimerase/dehydratase family protein [Streptomyces stackebrandtii]|uniref:NAD-dependent epimerase/dehydratase family protein n=1 Tax=Streptomyces stackebrandtii TaxID=3051177 RepID=UPI0037DA58ED